MKKTLGIIFILFPLFVGIIGLSMSILLGTSMDPNLLMIKNVVTWILGILSLISLIILIIGIILLAINSDTKISVKEAIGYGWEKSKIHTQRFLLGFGILIILAIINSIFNPSDAQIQTKTGLIVYILVNILNLWIMLGFSRIALDIVYEKKYKFTDLFIDFPKTISYFGAYIMMTIILIIGTFLFIFPAIIWSARLSMTKYFILDKGYNPWKALITSRKVTKGFTGDILAINIIGGLINILGFIALFVGLIRTVPILIIANAYIYKKIVNINKNILK